LASVPTLVWLFGGLNISVSSINTMIVMVMVIGPMAQATIDKQQQ
jgi:hypothetical protein